jgi:hypothetical protein
MLEIENLSKETVYNVMFQHLYAMNFGWFQFEHVIRAKHPEIIKGEEYTKVIVEYCSLEAKSLAKVLGITGTGMDSLIKLLQFSHWAVFEHFEVEKLAAESCRMRIADCSVQRAARKWGMKHYDCADVTLAGLRGFCNYVNQQMIVIKDFAPPEVSPQGVLENVSCSWVISIEGASA